MSDKLLISFLVFLLPFVSYFLFILGISFVAWEWVLPPTWLGVRVCFVVGVILSLSGWFATNDNGDPINLEEKS